MQKFVSLRWLPVLLLLVAAPLPTFAESVDIDRLGRELTPFLRTLAGRTSRFSLQGQIRYPDDSGVQTVDLALRRSGPEAFDLELRNSDYHVVIERSTDRTTLVLPKHRVVFQGTGEVNGTIHLAPRDLLDRLVSSRSLLSSFVPLTASDPPVAAALLSGLAKVSFDRESQRYCADRKVWFDFPQSITGHRWNLVTTDGISVELELHDEPSLAPAGRWETAAFRSIDLPRNELERVIARGVRRAGEILLPAPVLTNPIGTNRKVKHGELRWIGGHRVVRLQGTPEEVGHAHAQLLRQECLSCFDSVLHTFGLVQTISTGRWFRQDLEQAFARLEPHIPRDHLLETAALAAELGYEESLLQTLNVFPELFHCSGFAVFDSATKDGNLYHGRVLDYMTTIGLQDAATTFVVSIDGKIPFINVGYAGFIGSVSGMNAEKISLGEMGGRGEGQWDGVPMATLMRRALEECRSLDEVRQLWTDSPRTCEYYYVFADGETNSAVGVAATPASIEFVEPGASHPLLGEGIPDTVVLSAGSRLETLRARVQEHHGRIDAEIARWLMSRPVAMQSNLHNVLFIPAEGVLHVANADHDSPAADRPYLRLSLKEILGWSRSTDSVPLKTGP